MLNNVASIIKTSVTMTELCQRYGIEINRQGFAVCPFHNERTASLKIYDGTRGYSCYGCGKSGDVISFVQLLYGLSFSEALNKINDDFGLNLPLERRLSLREKHRFDIIEKQRLREKREREDLFERYRQAFNRWAELDRAKITYKPKSTDEPLHPEFIKALKGLALAEHQLNIAEGELYAYEMRRVRWQNDSPRHCR